MNIKFETNKELLFEFIDESIDELTSAETLFIKLESEPNNIDIINTIFRPVHSMKGNSAYFGLMKVKKLSHKMENLLDGLRKQQFTINKEIINILLTGIDCLKSILERVRKGENEVESDDEINSIISTIDNIIDKDSKKIDIPYSKYKEILSIIDQIDKNDQKILTLKNMMLSFDNEGNFNNTPKQFNKIKSILEQNFENGVASKKILEEIKEELKNLENYHKDPSFKNAFAEMKDIYDTFVNANIDFDNLAKELMIEKFEILLKVINKLPKEETSSKNKIFNKKDISDSSNKNSKNVKKDKTMRIPQSSLDVFLDRVGELIELEEVFKHLMHFILKEEIQFSFLNNFKQSVDQFSRVSENLLSDVMNIRKVESTKLLQKVPRLVRDIASSTDKKIDVITIGEDEKIDKSYIDLLDAPLTHMVRNSADHGIESPNDRVQKGKKESGTIKVELKTDDEYLFLIVSDDGKGLDYEALSLKAQQMGLLEFNKDITEKDIINILFQSGVSTANKVTDISGRGVGMDVVKQAIESNGGEISVENIPNKGCKFKITLPINITTKIVEGCIVKGIKTDNTFIIPMKYINEAFLAKDKNIVNVLKDGKHIERRDQIFPLLILDEILKIKDFNIKDDISELKSFLHIKVNNQNVILGVKEVLGVQKIVIKQMDKKVTNTNIFKEAAILGDGSIAFIIDENWLFSNI